MSGGSDRNGRVPLQSYVPAVRDIKSTTSLKINAHVGLATSEELERLVRAGVDAFSVDLFGDDGTVREVVGIDAKAEDYLSVVEQLIALGAPVVAPHICVGIRGGALGGEIAALRRLAPLSPSTLVLISLIPTKGTGYESSPAPRGEDIVSVVRAARAILPDTRLLMGCMRSRHDRSWEREAVLAGLDGIVLPSVETLGIAPSMGYTVRKKDTCCAFV